MLMSHLVNDGLDVVGIRVDELVEYGGGESAGVVLVDLLGSDALDGVPTPKFSKPL